MIQRLAAAVAAFACLFPLMPRPASAQDTPAFFSPSFDAYVTQAMKDWKVPGVSIAIVKDGKTYTKGYGVREVGKPGAVDGKTLFAIGSSSKAFTVALLGQLVDEKKIAWDDRVEDRLPGFAMYDAYASHELTIRDLLTHRGGLDGGDALWYGSDLGRDEIVRHIRYLKPAYSFRSRFEYNNLMFLTAGQVVAAVDGESWDDAVRKRLFAPLGMTSSNTTISGDAGNPNVAQPHEEIDGVVRAVPYRRIDDIGPAGSINSNADDLAHWMTMLLDGGSYGGKQLLKKTTLDEMWTPQTIIPLSFPWTLFAPASHFMDYGMGWILFDYRDHAAIQHAGNIDGMSALVSMLPDQHLGVAILTNKGSDFVGNAVMYRVFDDILGGAHADEGAVILEQFHTVFDAGLAAQKRLDDQRVPNTHPSLALDRYAGTYHNDLYGDATVTRDGDGLRFHLLGMKGRLEHWNYDTFRLLPDDVVGAKTPITFELDAHGNVASVSVGGDPQMLFPRVAAPK
ncbi:MAG: serine hydrolase [Candidatus Eremiobacteraeota bacterium]|nr:serine hydrolase [Candidatus Eremiobacteraeota bacterium]